MFTQGGAEEVHNSVGCGLVKEPFRVLRYSSDQVVLRPTRLHKLSSEFVRISPNYEAAAAGALVTAFQTGKAAKRYTETK